MRPCPVGHRLGGGAAGPAVAHVDLHRPDRLPRRGGGSHHLLGRLRVALVPERDVRTFGREQLDDRAADAPAAAGDDRHLAREAAVQRHRQPEMAKPPSTNSVAPLIMAASGKHSR